MKTDKKRHQALGLDYNKWILVSISNRVFSPLLRCSARNSAWGIRIEDGSVSGLVELDKAFPLVSSGVVLVE